MGSNFEMLTNLLPPAFKLRSGPGSGALEDGLCFMQVAALIGGEKLTDQPKCACPVLTAYGIALNDQLNDFSRQDLLPLAYGMAGTISEAHQYERMKLLGLASCDLARRVAHLNRDRRIADAIDAAEGVWLGRGRTQWKTVITVGVNAQRSGGADLAGTYVAEAAFKAAEAAADASNPSGSLRIAARCAAKAAYLACAASAIQAGHTNDQLKMVKLDAFKPAITALRDAILAGPNSLVELEVAQARVDAVSDQLPVSA